MFSEPAGSVGLERVSHERRNIWTIPIQKRQEKKISLRRLADQLGISAPYLSDVEKNRKTAFDDERIELVSRILNLSEEEKNKMLDLAGQAKKSFIPPDLPKYINGNDYVKVALRTARDMGAGAEDWQKFIDDLKRRKG